MRSRRAFFRDSGLALAGLGLPRVCGPFAVALTALRRPLLVVIFMRGGVDGLNVVVPWREREYYRRRPGIAVPSPGAGRDAAIDLDGVFALHPALARLMPLYRSGRLALVHACGAPGVARSHFEAQRQIESGSSGAPEAADGWLNRLLCARPVADADRLRALALAPLPPCALQGSAPVAVVHPACVPAAALNEAVVYPRTRFGAALQQLAAIVRRSPGLEVAWVESGAWDHHAAEGGATGVLAARLHDFGQGLAAFVQDLGDRSDDVLIITLSEFGRALGENSEGGTDHGHGGVVLLVGPGVRGGRVYGRWPGLAPECLHDGGLAVTTDVRDVCAELVTVHCGVQDASGIFPGWRAAPSGRVGVLRAS